MLHGIDLSLRPGEIHALVGENGAGKSTLMNVLAGRFDDYRGRIVINGAEEKITTPRQARELGIASRCLPAPDVLPAALEIARDARAGAGVEPLLDAFARPRREHGPRVVLDR